jgi:hypothetical protein
MVMVMVRQQLLVVVQREKGLPASDSGLKLAVSISRHHQLVNHPD